MYQDGISSTQIADKYNVCIDNKYHNLTLNHDYFENIDSYDKAYFLGFLVTDGSVGSTDNSIAITLKASDYQILEVLSNKIGNSNKLYFSQRNEAVLRFKSAKIKQNLAMYDVRPNKTYNGISLPIIKDELMPHLVRGIIDGDGWISVKSHQFGLCGCETLVTQVRDYLVNTIGVYQVKILHISDYLWQITWGSKKDILSIGEYIYQDKQDCYLQRKYENFMEIPR